MNFQVFFTLKSLSRSGLQPVTCSWRRWYAVKPQAALGKKMGAGKLSKIGAVVEKRVMPVETDPEKLVNYVCGSNIYLTGEDIKLKPDSEYPDWLQNIHIGRPKKLEELDPNKKEYWRKLRTMGMRRNNTLQKLKKF